MSARIIDGRALAAKLRADIAAKIAARASAGHRRPGLAVILAGADAASKVYVRHKKRACEEVGIESNVFELAADAAQDELLSLVRRLNDDDRIDGILAQLPLPAAIDADAVIEAVAQEKDVDGFHPCNLGRLSVGRPRFRPCTPQGVMRLLQSTGAALAGMSAVIIGRSRIVGRPMAFELLAADCTPQLCHSKTRDLPARVRAADIVVSAVGAPRMIKGDWIKPGAIVIDVGVNRLADGSLAGDVDYPAVAEIAAYITPVPGGVGPMTVACLLRNTLLAAENRTAAST